MAFSTRELSSRSELKFSLPHLSSSRWPEAIPIPDMTAETIARTFVARWVAVFRAPTTITTDRGRQFESALFLELTNLLGTNRIRTTSYHPASNGLVERLHRQLKAAIKTHNNTRWTEVLPLVFNTWHTHSNQDGYRMFLCWVGFWNGTQVASPIRCTNKAWGVHLPHKVNFTTRSSRPQSDYDWWLPSRAEYTTTCLPFIYSAAMCFSHAPGNLEVVVGWKNTSPAINEEGDECWLKAEDRWTVRTNSTGHNNLR